MLLGGRGEEGGALLANLFLAPIGVLFVPDSLMLDPDGGSRVSTPRFGSFCCWRWDFSQVFSMESVDLLEV